jgi:hypothetical protein
MKEKSVKVIPINWAKPDFLISDVHTAKFDLSEIPDKQNVLYQIYGDSPIYGSETLLYVGKTIRPVKERIQKHLDTNFNRIINFSIRVGEFDFQQTDNIEDILNITETILITMLKPSYNAQNLKDIINIAQNTPYLILNKGNRGLLPLEVSNIWWF